MAKHRKHDDDELEPVEGDLFQAKQSEGTRTMERDSGDVQGFEYFGVDTRDQEEN